MKKSKAPVKKSKKRNNREKIISNECQKSESLHSTSENELSSLHENYFEDEEVTSFNCNSDSAKCIEQTKDSREVESRSAIEPDNVSNISDVSSGSNLGRSKVECSRLTPFGERSSSNHYDCYLWKGSSQLQSDLSNSENDDNERPFERPFGRFRNQNTSQDTDFTDSVCDLSAPRYKKSVSFSSSLVSHSESYTKPQENSFNSTNLASILAKPKSESLTRSMISKSESNTAVENCSRNLYQRNFIDKDIKQKLKSPVTFRDYLHTSASTFCDLESTAFNTTCSSLDYVEPNVSLDLKSIPGDSSENKHDSCFLDYDDFDYSGCKQLEDSSDFKLPLYTSTPCKSQTSPPDLINICEREILKTLEPNDEKLPNISLMVDLMETDVKHLEEISKRKESNNKMLQESFDTMKKYVSMAEKLNNSICSKTDSINVNLFSLLESSKDDLGKFNKRILLLINK